MMINKTASVKPKEEAKRLFNLAMRAEQGYSRHKDEEKVKGIAKDLYDGELTPMDYMFSFSDAVEKTETLEQLDKLVSIYFDVRQSFKVVEKAMGTVHDPKVLQAALGMKCADEANDTVLNAKKEVYGRIKDSLQKMQMSLANTNDGVLDDFNTIVGMVDACGAFRGINERIEDSAREGKTPQEISQMLGVDKQTVSKRIAAMRQQMQEPQTKVNEESYADIIRPKVLSMLIMNTPKEVVEQATTIPAFPGSSEEQQIASDASTRAFNSIMNEIENADNGADVKSSIVKMLLNRMEYDSKI